MADIMSDEDELFYSMVLTPAFKSFHKKSGRYPTNWHELNRQDSCIGYFPAQRKNFPKPNEGVVWKPNHCRLAYRIQSADKRNFRVVALAGNHVVSINDTFRVTYLKTPYHDHGPYDCPGSKLDPRIIC